MAALAPFAAACGAVATPSGPSADVTAACKDLFAHRLAYAARCTGPAASPRAEDEPAHVASCVGVLAAPGVALTLADVASCAHDLGDAAPCLGSGVFPRCAGYGADMLFPAHDRRGTRAPGEACFAAVQCDSGYCGASYGRCGTCQRARAVGDVCGGGDDVCVLGQCTAGTCQLPGQQLGEACVDYGTPCQASLFCAAARDPLHGTCAPRTNGTLCGSAWCPSPLACVDGNCQGPLPQATGLPEGADCAAGSCRADLSCDERHVCRAVYVLPIGAACTVTGIPACAASSYCHADVHSGEGRCEALPRAGSPCTDFLLCAEGAECAGDGRGSPRTCVAQGKVGEPCPCGDGLTCVGGACTAWGGAVCR